MAYLFAGPVTASAMTLTFQAAEGDGGIPWWVWFVLLSVLLLLLLIGFARQPEPGEPLPKPGERITPPAAVAVESSQEEAPEASAAADEVAGEEATQTPEADDAEVAATVSETGEEEPAPADDLQRIEGIGPKIAGTLADNGITSFATLASAEPQRLQEILDAADIRLADPGTWPKQAALAEAGQWDELEKLQDSLKGGRQN